jgi:tRNA threonylcarbamoyladenosine biosynthesis protein TsaB
MTQIALALNTTTEVLELTLAHVNPLIYIKSNDWNLGRELSVQIHICLAEFMGGNEWSDLAFIAIASGVGSFTSTRIGIVLARTLGEQLGIPVYAANCKDIENYSLTSEQDSIMSLMEIAHARWIKGDRSDWSQALPLYA